MKAFFRNIEQWILALVLASCLMGLAGCASTEESENASLRPWNTPRSWENGVPAGLTEGR